MTKQKVDAQAANEKKSEDVENASAAAVQSGAQEESGAEGAGEPGPQPEPRPDPNAPPVASGAQTTPVFSDVECELIGGLVVEKLREILPPILEGQLPDLVAKLLPETPEQKAAREQEFARIAAAEDASNARKEQGNRDRATAKAAKEAAEKRAAAQADAAKAFDGQFGPHGKAKGFVVGDVEKAVLVLDDGKAFCIDFVKEIDAAQLVQVDDMVRLSPKVDLGGDMPSFIVRGVSLQVGSELAMRCEIPTPLHIGDGRTAQLTADSLVFRAPVKPAAVTD